MAAIRGITLPATSSTDGFSGPGQPRGARALKAGSMNRSHKSGGSMICMSESRSLKTFFAMCFHPRGRLGGRFVPRVRSRCLRTAEEVDYGRRAGQPARREDADAEPRRERAIDAGWAWDSHGHVAAPVLVPHRRHG